jgi:hypothetical protein
MYTAPRPHKPRAGARRYIPTTATPSANDGPIIAALLAGGFALLNTGITVL